MNITEARAIWKNKDLVLTSDITRNGLTWRGETIFLAGSLQAT